MKIEIGESLIFSWLRHVMGCPIAQTNWKPSPTWPIRREAGLAGDFEKMREIATQRFGFEVFKKSSLQQFIRQAEIDVLGLRFGDTGPATVAVDSAFHEAGVNYGDLGETVGRILKKMDTSIYRNLGEVEVAGWRAGGGGGRFAVGLGGALTGASG